MVELIWTEPALQELDAIAEYIALDKPLAASRYVEKVFKKVERLELFPRSGKKVNELPNTPYLELVVPLAVFSIGTQKTQYTYCTLCAVRECSESSCLSKLTPKFLLTRGTDEKEIKGSGNREQGQGQGQGTGKGVKQGKGSSLSLTFLLGKGVKSQFDLSFVWADKDLYSSHNA